MFLKGGADYFYTFFFSAAELRTSRDSNKSSWTVRRKLHVKDGRTIKYNDQSHCTHSEMLMPELIYV